MGLGIGQFTFDCEDPAALAGFWAEAVSGEPIGEPNPFMAQIAWPAGAAMLFIKVPESKSAKNRCHLDLEADDAATVDAEIGRLTGLGAEHVATFTDYGVHWATFRDPEGNEFCVGAAADQAVQG